jgi:carbon storage regulator CsrA
MGNLIITRKPNEKFMLLNSNNKIIAEITLLQISRGQTRISIIADEDIKIYREEVLAKIKAGEKK